MIFEGFFISVSIFKFNTNLSRVFYNIIQVIQVIQVIHVNGLLKITFPFPSYESPNEQPCHHQSSSLTLDRIEPIVDSL